MVVRVMCIGLMVACGSCFHSYFENADGDFGRDASAESDAIEVSPADDAVADIDVDVEDTADVVAEVDEATCPGWNDPAMHLCWQDPPEEELRNWYNAVAHCTGLVLGGLDGWHLPTINELRSFIRGCPDTEIGGRCHVTDACLMWHCWNEADCGGCSETDDGRGPGSGGAYWPPEASGTPYWYWSSSSYYSRDWEAWVVYFPRGYVDRFEKELTFRVRCVRPGP